MKKRRAQAGLIRDAGKILPPCDGKSKAGMGRNHRKDGSGRGIHRGEGVRVRGTGRLPVLADAGISYKRTGCPHVLQYSIFNEDVSIGNPCILFVS